VNPAHRSRLIAASVWLATGAVAVAFFAYVPEPPVRPLFAGAGRSGPRDGGTFRFYAGSNVRTLDPLVGYDELSTTINRLLFDGLLDYADDGTMIPRLATAMPTVTNEGKTFTFTLRRGVRFHNGRELVAEDVRFTIERLLTPSSGSPGYSFYMTIRGAAALREGRAQHAEGIRVLDRYTIAFDLDSADQTFLNAMAMVFAYPVPRENYARWGSRVREHPIGTGPYRFDHWERGVSIRLSRFDAYWDRRGRPDHLVFTENLTGKMPLNRFRRGELDLLMGVGVDEYMRFRDAPEWAPYRMSHPESVTVGLTMNCELPPFDDVHVRRAVAFALDRASWQRLNQYRVRPATQALPPVMPGYDASLPNAQRFDVAEARREMALSRYASGWTQPIDLWVNEEGSVASQFIQQDLARIGLTIRARPTSFATYLEETGKPRRAQAFISAWGADFPDPSNFLFLFQTSSISREGSSENRSFYSNREVDALLERARADTDRDRRMSLYHQANDIVARDAPWAFLHHPESMEIWQPYVVGYRPHPVWSNNYRDLWLDLPRRALGADTRIPAMLLPTMWGAR
jgi:ABC-type transport system substrate-binding protein